MNVTIESLAEAPAPARRASAESQPIIAGFHPDPSICRAGEDYYLVNSSFEYSPGVPVWHSTDLVSWTLIGNAFAGEQERTAGHAASSGGIFAPTIRFHRGRFWIITTDVGTSDGQVVTWAVDPAGPWSPLRRLEGLRGIDPDLAWDGDECLVTYCSTDPALPGIVQARVDLDRAVLLDTPRAIWSGTGLAFPEAPHLYQHGEWWYLVIAEGGTERGHGVTVARSASPRGPFEPAPHNPVLTHRSTDHPVQNTGHADLVEGPDGEWAAVYLAVRPAGVTPMFHVNGRETFLAGVRWENGWPVFDETSYQVPLVDRSFEDTLEGRLHPRWVSPGLPLSRQVVPVDGGVEIREATGAARAMTAVVTRVVDRRWMLAVTIADVRGTAGALVRLDDSHWVEVRVTATEAVAVARIGPLEQPLTPPVRLAEGSPVTARIQATAPTSGGPDDLVLSILQDGREHPLGRIDGRYLSTEVAGGFTGRVCGLRAVIGRFRLERVAYSALP